VGLLRQPAKRLLATSLFAIVWIAAVAFGSRALFHYENAPGRVGALPRTWPAAHLERAKDRPTLVMVAHPHCPCTAASMGELAKIMAQLQGRVAAYVLFVRPRGGGTDWEETALRRDAEAIPGVRVAFDRDGADAQRFGAETSGHTLLFGADGALLFSGGITASRGHAGDNVGESAILALVDQQTPARIQTLVFGCSLTNRPEGLPAVCLR
jgi:hypothetical protein